MVSKYIKTKLSQRLNISFSRTGDDIQLFKLVNSSTPGFYVDIGSWHPTKASNSYFFYLRKWKGICIDPNPELAKLYKKIRPNDVFLNAGVGMDREILSYYMLEKRHESMNTLNYDFLTQEKVEQEIKKIIEVPVLPLSDILNVHIQDNDRLDFFDIDVEGSDLEVLKSNDWKRFRPKIIMVESNLDFKSEVSSGIANYLEEVNYRLLGKSNINGNLGNLFFMRIE